MKRNPQAHPGWDMQNNYSWMTKRSPEGCIHKRTPCFSGRLDPCLPCSPGATLCSWAGNCMAWNFWQLLGQIWWLNKWFVSLITGILLMGPCTVHGEKFMCTFQTAQRGHFKCPQIKKSFFFDGDSLGWEAGKKQKPSLPGSACPPSGKTIYHLFWDAWLWPLPSVASVLSTDGPKGATVCPWNHIFVTWE